MALTDEQKAKLDEATAAPTSSVEVVSREEPWTSYKLADGTTIKFRLNLSPTFERVKGAWNPDGNPIYNFAILQPQFVVIAPAALKRP